VGVIDVVGRVLGEIVWDQGCISSQFRGRLG